MQIYDFCWCDVASLFSDLPYIVHLENLLHINLEGQCNSREAFDLVGILDFYLPSVENQHGPLVFDASESIQAGTIPYHTYCIDLLPLACWIFSSFWGDGFLERLLFALVSNFRHQWHHGIRQVLLHQLLHELP